MDQRRGSPSNRKGTSAKYADSLVTVGIDRVSLSFPVDSWDQREGQWDQVSHRTPRGGAESRMWSAREGRFFVGVMMAATAPGDRRLWGKVEWNPSRVLDPDGWGLAPADELRLTVGPAMAAVATRMRPAIESVDESRVKRLDVAKDFSVGDEASSVIRSLAAVHRPWSRLNMVHADPRRNGAQTLMVGSKSAGVTRLYDKRAETGGEAPEGTLRFEVEAKSDWCGRYGSISYLGDVTSESVEALGHERFGWSGMGCEISSSVSRLVHVVTAAESLSESEKTYFLGFLVQQAAGAQPALSPRSLSKYRRVQRELGIVAADLSETVEIVRRLDWEMGREVLRVA